MSGAKRGLWSIAMYLSAITIGNWLHREVPVRLMVVDVGLGSCYQLPVQAFHMPFPLLVLLDCCIQLDSSERT